MRVFLLCLFLSSHNCPASTLPFNLKFHSFQRPNIRSQASFLQASYSCSSTMFVYSQSFTGFCFFYLLGLCDIFWLTPGSMRADHIETVHVLMKNSKTDWCVLSGKLPSTSSIRRRAVGYQTSLYDAIGRRLLRFSTGSSAVGVELFHSIVGIQPDDTADGLLHGIPLSETVLHRGTV